MRASITEICPQSKIIIIEFISVPSTIQTLGSPDAASSLRSLDGETYKRIPAPPFIPANFGAATKGYEALVLHLLGIMNAQGRTLVRLYTFRTYSPVHTSCDPSAGELGENHWVCWIGG